MAYRIVFAREAEESRDDIIDYLLNTLDNKQAALHFMDSLDDALSVVASNPGIYAVSREPRLARMGYRPCLFMNYVALYRIEGDIVLVSFIFHTSQDYFRLT